MMFSATTLVTFVVATIPYVGCQALQPQRNTFNSNFELSNAQISSLGLNPAQANNLNIAVQFEQTNWATGSVRNDPFYTDISGKAKNAPAGTVLKTEAFTIPTNYTIAPTLSLSRIVYQSKTLNGSLAPVSAFILWPYTNRNGASRTPLVSWGHGTAGIFAECAPSHIRNLLYQFSAPFELALSGFAVVASDYAGLGVPFYPDGTPIVHQYVGSPAAGNDMLYAAQAAYSAFPNQLTKEYVVMGHSQGGGAAWAAAQQQVKEKVPGYLGTIAISPVTSAFEIAKVTSQSIGLIQLAKSLPSAFPQVKMSDMLTAKGIALFKLLEEIQGCNSAFQQVIKDIFAVDQSNSLTKDSFLQSPDAEQWNKQTVAGGKDFKGPMLVIQGDADVVVPPQVTSEYVQRTCKKYSKNGLEYIIAKGVGHFPTLYATQQLWLAWLDQRFGNKNSYSPSSSAKCSYETVGQKLPRPLNQYTGNLNYFLEFSLDGYQTA
ncbi:Fc.00g093040.m01.CDS01 [Cosmosporella sp. VM-42]